MAPAWAQRREALLSDCLVSPDVFTQMVDRLREFVVPYRPLSLMWSNDSSTLRGRMTSFP
jgi:hypothetical protein